MVLSTKMYGGGDFGNSSYSNEVSGGVEAVVAMRVAFTGRAGSGKSTAARYLAETYGFHRLSFATPLREMVSVLFDMNTFRQKTPEGRRLLQAVGVAMRDVDEAVWIRLLEAQLNRLPAKANVVVDDCRFANEGEFLRHAGFTIIKLERLNLAQLASEAASHVSETSVDLVAYTEKWSGLALAELLGALDRLVNRGAR